VAVDNCLFLTRYHAVNFTISWAAPNASLRLVNNTMVVGGWAANVPRAVPEPERGRTPVPLDARRNVCSSGFLHFICYSPSKEADAFVQREHRSLARQFVALEDQGNVLGPGSELVGFAVAPQAGAFSRKDGITTLDGWRDFWKPEKTDAVVGPVPFHGPQLSPETAAPERLTPQDFRLRADSAAGADVDLVGPGAAYERSKATPVYRQWLAEAGRMTSAVRPFAVLSEGKPERPFATLTEAAASASGGDVIEIRGDGPFISGPVNLKDKALTIRAGAGSSPFLRLSKDELPPNTPLLRTRAALVLEGLELRRDDRERPQAGRVEYLVESTGAPVRLANCRFEVALRAVGGAAVGLSSPVFEARNCLFVVGGTFADWVCPTGGRLALENNAVRAGSTAALFCHFRDGDTRDVSLRLARNTVAGTGVGFFVHGLPKGLTGDPPLRLELTDNVFAADGRYLSMFPLNQQQAVHSPGQRTLPAAEAEALYRQLVAWRERRNVYTEPATFLRLYSTDGELTPTRPRTALADWEQFWGLKDTGSVQGRVRFRGNAPDRPTPDDLRLAADSKGYRAGEGGRDLGVDTDLVGPGPAYERWKTTPDYQAWLKGPRPKE
jgi:hypothetical protein